MMGSLDRALVFPLQKRKSRSVDGVQGRAKSPRPWGCRGSLEALLTGGCRRPDALRVIDRRYGLAADLCLDGRIGGLIIP